MKPRVTVILPTYNWTSVLRYSISSVLRQTFTDFELLVIGDGCTDDSERVVAESGDARVRWINLPENTRHQSGPNNEGLRQARGEIIAYHGHDDLWLPHHLAVMVNALQSSGADLAHSLCLMVPSEGESGWLLIPQRELGSYAPPLCVVHRRSLTERIGGWRHYRELGTTPPDVELWRRAAASRAMLTFVPRLTGIKFPASARRDVYRTRPHHEQAAWAARIVSDPDLEAHLLAHAVTLRSGLMESWSYRELLRGFIRQTVRRMRTRLRFRSESLDVIRRYKGLQEPSGEVMFTAARKDGQLVTKEWQFIQPPIDGVSFHEVRHVPRDHGVITETYRPEWDPSGLPIVHVYQSRLYPGAIGAWSCHARTIDRLFVNHGHLKVVLYDGREEGPTYGHIMELHAGDARPIFLHIPIGVWHGVQNVGTTDALMLNYPSRAYDYEDPDHYRLPWDANEIPYRWVADGRTRLRSDHE